MLMTGQVLEKLMVLASLINSSARLFREAIETVVGKGLRAV